MRKDMNLSRKKKRKWSFMGRRDSFFALSLYRNSEGNNPCQMNWSNIYFHPQSLLLIMTSLCNECWPYVLSIWHWNLFVLFFSALTHTYQKCYKKKCFDRKEYTRTLFSISASMYIILSTCFPKKKKNNYFILSNFIKLDH